ncbi:aldo/keto reductase [bacterium]|nr:aldo/keto reductase [bacterium]
MTLSRNHAAKGLSRRNFLRTIGKGMAGGALAGFAIGREGAFAGEVLPEVKRRQLGRTGLMVSEIGFGGHSWSYAQVPDGDKMRVASETEALEMVRTGLEMGVNFFDSDTPQLEHTVPGKAVRKLNARKDVIVCARLVHKMKGQASDKEEVYKFVDERLKMWQTDYFDILFTGMATEDYWDMSYCIEALEKVKKAGKCRFTGFGSHFSRGKFVEAIEKYGKAFDICSMPYNVYHRGAEDVLPAAEQCGLGIVTIKPFARGSLLKKKDLEGKDKGLPRRMIAYVIENKHVDCCVCGVHTIAHVRENFSASANPLSPEERLLLQDSFGSAEEIPLGWLDRGWRYA